MPEIEDKMLGEIKEYFRIAREEGALTKYADGVADAMGVLSIISRYCVIPTSDDEGFNYRQVRDIEV